MCLKCVRTSKYHAPKKDRKVKKEVQAVDVIQQVPDLSYLERALLLIGWNEYNLGLKN